MSPANPSLDILPAEVIQKIASHLSFPSMLSLWSTNSTTRTVTNHGTTFKALLSNDSHKSQSQAASKWDFIDTLKENQDIEFWARYALADQKAIELFNDPDMAEGSKVTAWAPQLVVLRRKSFRSPPLLIQANKVSISQIPCFRIPKLQTSTHLLANPPQLKTYSHF